MSECGRAAQEEWQMGAQSEMEKEKKEKEIEEARSVREFRAVKALGRGDMGTVFLATHMPSGKAVAMKVIKKDAVALPQRSRCKRALTEAKILRMLEHPFLPTLYTAIHSPTHLYLFMTYCSGGHLNLLRLMQRHRRFSQPIAKFYAAEVVVALEYLHKRGIVYRDLKPENILVQSSGHIMLTDFDLSLVLGQHEGEADGDGENEFVGTEEYVAPEVLWGDRHGFAMDWWALGVVLYEMVYGCTPFKGPCRRHTFFNVLCNDVPFPPFDSDQDVHLRDLIGKLLAKEPSKRLGFANDAMDIKCHPFFRGLRWDGLQFICRPPFVPPFSCSPQRKSMQDVLDMSP